MLSRSCRFAVRHRQRIQSISTQQDTLREIKQVFPNFKDIYSRIDLLTSANPPRVAIIPFDTHKTETKSLLDCVLADPLSSEQQWYTHFKHRLLSKDTLIRFTQSSDFVLTHNSLVEYPLPPRKTETEILEANSYVDSYEHIRKCHLHIFVCKDLRTALTKSVPSFFPSIVVVDIENNLTGENILLEVDGDQKVTGSPSHTAGVDETSFETVENARNASRDGADSESSSSDSFVPPPRINQAALAQRMEAAGRRMSGTDRNPSASTEQTIVVSTTWAQEGIDLLIESPENASKFLDYRRQSNIPAVEDLIFDSAEDFRKRLTESVARDCDEFLVHTKENLAVIEQETKNMTELRREFAQSAHEELQGSLADSLATVTGKTLAWYKLYYLVDDVLDISSSIIYHKFLPQTQHNYEYLLGKVDSFSFDTFDPSLLAKIDNQRAQLIKTSCVELHDSALATLLSVILGLQLPSFFLAGMAWYFYGFSVYAVGSVAMLGFVVGLRKLQTTWGKHTRHFTKSVLESARIAIGDCESTLFNRWERKVVYQSKLVGKERALIDQLKAAVNKN